MRSSISIWALLLAEKALPFYAQSRFYNWIDIGRVTDYWSVLQRVLRGEVAEMSMPGKDVEPGVWFGPNTSIEWGSSKIVGPVYIGSSVRIGHGCSVDRPRQPPAPRYCAGLTREKSPFLLR
jgi:mannose-1-phosphate guanylyltransferase